MEKEQFRVTRKTIWEALRVFPPERRLEALVFLFLETGPITNWTGVFPAPLVDVARYTQSTVAEVGAAIDNLQRWGAIVYDHDRQLVCVKGLLLRQMNGRPHKNQAVGIVRHIRGFADNSPVVKAFIDEHANTPELAALFQKAA